MNLLTTDPDRAFRNLDDEVQYRYLLFDSPMAETLFAAHYLDLELDPYQDFILKLIRGRFHAEEEIGQFIVTHKMEWLFENGWIRHGGFDGVSPYYFTKPNVLVLLPAGFGKTTIVMTRVLPVVELCDNPNVRLQFVGKNETEGFSFSSSIRQELLNPKLREDFGDFKPADRGISWSDQSFSIAQRQWKDVRQNCEFFGTNSHAALGKRCDRGLLDDIETPDTARTPDMRDKLLEWVRIGPLTAPRPLWPRDKLGRVLIPAGLTWSKTARYWGTAVVGTIFHPQGLYAMLMADPTFTCVKFDCYRDKRQTVSLSEKMLTVEDLKREQRSIGTLAFNKRFRNIAYDQEEMAFREAWVRGQEEEVGGQRIKHPGCLDGGFSFGQHHPRWELYLGFDPASGSKSKWSAHSAYVLLGSDPKDEKRRLWLIDYAKLQENFDRMLDWLLEGNSAYGIEGFYAKYRYKVATVEQNAFGTWLVNNDRMKPYVAQKLVVPHQTQGQNKNDPVAGVFAMGAVIQDGRLRIPYREASDQEKAEEFVKDLLLYPKGTNDLVMALWLAQLPIAKGGNYRSWFTKGGHGFVVKNPAHTR